jgi:hypothetical protein
VHESLGRVLQLGEQLGVPMRDENDPKRHPQQQQSERLQFLKTFHVHSPGIQSPSRRIDGLFALSCVAQLKRPHCIRTAELP